MGVYSEPEYRREREAQKEEARKEHHVFTGMGGGAGEASGGYVGDFNRVKRGEDTCATSLPKKYRTVQVSECDNGYVISLFETYHVAEPACLIKNSVQHTVAGLMAALAEVYG